MYCNPLPTLNHFSFPISMRSFHSLSCPDIQHAITYSREWFGALYPDNLLRMSIWSSSITCYYKENTAIKIALCVCHICAGLQVRETRRYGPEVYTSVSRWLLPSLPIWSLYWFMFPAAMCETLLSTASPTQHVPVRWDVCQSAGVKTRYCCLL